MTADSGPKLAACRERLARQAAWDRTARQVGRVVAVAAVVGMAGWLLLSTSAVPWMVLGAALALTRRSTGRRR